MFLVRAGFVIVGVTAGTIRSECSIPIVDLLGIGLVAVRTRQVVAMILRFVRKIVTVVGRCPCICRVTDIALYRSAKVVLILASCCDAVVA